MYLPFNTDICVQLNTIMLFMCLSVLLSVRCLGIGAETVDVKTSSGTVRGQTITELGKELNQFYGIPFAEPPVGALRFAKPKPITKPSPVSNLFKQTLTKLNNFV